MTIYSNDYYMGRLDNQTVDGLCNICGKTPYRLLYVIINGLDYLSIICLTCGRSVDIEIGV